MHEPAYRRLVEAFDRSDLGHDLGHDLGTELAQVEARLHQVGRRFDNLVRPSPYLAFYARVVETARPVALAASA